MPGGVTPTSPQGSGTGPVPCLVLGIALGPCPAVAGADPEVTDLPWAQFEATLVPEFCPSPRPQLAPASQHQARLNPCSLGHFSPPYLKVITKDGGAPCTPQSPAAAPAAPALSSSSAPLNLSILPQARPGPGSPSSTPSPI